MKILIFGLSGSGKTTLAKPFAELINGVHINADDIRTKHNDWDFSIKGRHRQSLRMGHIADGVVMAGKIAVLDFICPTAVTRDWVNADYTIWMDTVKESKYKDTDVIFQKPDLKEVNYHVNEWFDDTHTQLVDIIKTYMERNNASKS
jgi:adenylylsulfate kinase